MSDFLDLDELYDVHKKQDTNRIKIFREIYRKCLAKMKHTNNTLRRMECNFQVPSFVWGIPIYDYDDLKDYILFRLDQNGLINCYFIDKTTLYMTWKPEDIDKKKYQAAKKKVYLPTTSNSTADNSGIVGSDTLGQQIPALTAIGLGDNSAYKKNDTRPTSGMMKFDDIYEVPVNLDKVRKLKSAGLGFVPRTSSSVTTGLGSFPGPTTLGNISWPSASASASASANGYPARSPASIAVNNSRIPGHTISKTTPSIVPPSRQLMDSWKNYLNKKKGIA